MMQVAARKSFIGSEEKRISPLVWPNLLCLDAPLVAVSWHWFFAWSFSVTIPAGTTAALFLTAWLIYLGDRFVDSLAIPAGAAMSLRQTICLRFRGVWIVGLLGVAAADGIVILRALDPLAVLFGCAIGAGAAIYLLVNQLRPTLWRVLPVKEISIGCIFAAGAMVGLLRGLPAAAALPWLLFAAVCVMNCICIAVWERPLDIAQQRISVATEFPAAERLILPVLLLLGLTSLSAAALLPTGGSVCTAVAASAALLAIVHVRRHFIAADVRTALADLVLLTPFVFAASS